MPFGISFRCGTSPHSFLERHDIGDLDSPFTGLVPVTTNSLIVAPIPAQHLLVEVVGHSPSIGARSVLPSVFVGQKAIVRHVVNSNCVEATLQEKILSSFMFASNALVALFQVSVDGFSGHYLQSSHKLELIIDVFQVNACSFRGPEFVEMLFQAVRQEYGVSIDLDSPVEVLVGTLFLDFLPDLLKGIDVGEGTPFRFGCWDPIIEIVAITLANAHPVHLDVVRKLCLGTPKRLWRRCFPIDYRKAIQRSSMSGSLGTSRSQALHSATASLPSSIPSVLCRRT
mmetsp:Transcript_83587/g.174846  ORF Transcript_83587/g.174846 Transcript_83587/m.174846 type:complete len:284 (+) Transcript_83587:173-1024(+)